FPYLPLPVVCGVQLSQGLSFTFSAIKYIQFNQDFLASKSTTSRPWLGLDEILLALSSLLFLVLTTGSGTDTTTTSDKEPRRQPLARQIRILSSIPAMLIVFLLGLAFYFIRDLSIFINLKFGPSQIRVLKITWEDWKIEFLKGAVPQIPLSKKNSVIAVCMLSTDLFPDRELSTARVSISLRAMNLVRCWFRAMPVCHGAGGLAGQYRFGARSGMSVVILGMGTRS
ncbi:Molybdate transporter 2, partial [Linum perenne]